MKKNLKTNSHKIIKKTWGQEIVYYNKNYCYKELCFNPSTQTSMHRHKKKKETFIVKDKGLALEYVDSFTNMSYIIELSVFKSYTIRPKTWHRIYNNTDKPLSLFEVSTHHKDSDVERMEI